MFKCALAPTGAAVSGDGNKTIICIHMEETDELDSALKKHIFSPEVAIMDDKVTADLSSRR